MKKVKRKTVRRQLAPVKLRVMAEYGSSGIWLIQQVGVFRHSMVGYSSLGIPRELAKRFEEWIAVYENKSDETSDYDCLAFNAEGRLLAQAVKHHVGSDSSVEFLAETPEGGLSPAEEIV